MAGTVKGGQGAHPASEMRAREERARGENPFRGLTLAQLRMHARDLGIIGYSRLRKAELAREVESALKAKATEDAGD